MSRRNSAAAEHAAAAASEAARVLQQRGQESKRTEATPEPQETEVLLSDERIEQLQKNNPNSLAREEIIASRNKEPEVTEEPKAIEKPAEKPQEDPKVAEAPATSPEVAVAPEAPKTVKVKVDGEEFEAPAEEVEAAGGVRAYQVQRAADNRLKKSNEALAESRKTQSEIMQLATALLAQRNAIPAKPQESDQQFNESKLDIIRFGTPAEGAAALMEIMQRAQPKAVDANSIIEQATARIRHDNAVSTFDRKYQDIVTNPIRLKAVVALRQERLDRHKIENPNQPVDWDRFYDTIGLEVRSAFGGSSQVATPSAATSGTPSPTSDKEARKASIVNLPAAAAKAEAPKEDKPETREDVIAEMRRKRGQLVG